MIVSMIRNLLIVFIYYLYVETCVLNNIFCCRNWNRCSQEHSWLPALRLVTAVPSRLLRSCICRRQSDVSFFFIYSLKFCFRYLLIVDTLYRCESARITIFDYYKSIVCQSILRHINQRSHTAYHRSVLLPNIQFLRAIWRSRWKMFLTIRHTR